MTDEEPLIYVAGYGSVVHDAFFGEDAKRGLIPLGAVIPGMRHNWGVGVKTNPDQFTGRNWYTSSDSDEVSGVITWIDAVNDPDSELAVVLTKLDGGLAQYREREQLYDIVDVTDKLRMLDGTLPEGARVYIALGKPEARELADRAKADGTAVVRPSQFANIKKGYGAFKDKFGVDGVTEHTLPGDEIKHVGWTFHHKDWRATEQMPAFEVGEDGTVVAAAQRVRTTATYKSTWKDIPEEAWNSETPDSPGAAIDNPQEWLDPKLVKSKGVDKGTGIEL